MLLTEDQAKDKRCCGPDDCGVRRPLQSIERYCIGSACMAWRLAGLEYEYVDAEGAAGPPPGEGWVFGPREHSARSAWKRQRPRRGYCGLAGQP